MRIAIARSRIRCAFLRRAASSHVRKATPTIPLSHFVAAAALRARSSSYIATHARTHLVSTVCPNMPIARR